MTSDTPRPDVYGPWFVAGMLMLCAIAWMLGHPYEGIFHDANLYTLQALSHIDTSLRRDVFLKFGSQDHFTVFSPLYAQFIQWLGVEQAAALLTLLSQLFLIAAAFLLVRASVTRNLVLLGLLVFIVTPGDYGPARVFTSMESFLTPRMLSEALSLSAIAAGLHGKIRVCWCLGFGAVLIHPVMGLAGVTALLALLFFLPRPRSTLIFAALGIAALLLSLALPQLGGRFDQTWLSLVHARSPYLFMAEWQLDDWSRAGVVITTLLIGSIALTEPSRRLCRAALIVTLSGWLITFVAADCLHDVLFTQLQSWRWQWLGTTVAAVLLPAVISQCWHGSTADRSAALLLACAWIFGEGQYGCITSVAAIGMLAARRLPPRQQTLFLWGACGLCVIAVAWRIATNLEFTNLHYLDERLPLWLRRAMSFTHDGFVVIVAGTLFSLVYPRIKPRFLRTAPLIIAVITAAAISPFAGRQWMASPPDMEANFAGWRDLVPAGAEVFWPEATHQAWTLLRRPSYLSGLQTSGLVFSRTASLELQRRAEALQSVVPPDTFLEWSHIGLTLQLSKAQLERACSLAVFPYLVTSAKLDARLLNELHNQRQHAERSLKLYGCAKQKG